MKRKQTLSHTAEQSDKLPVWCLYPHFKKRVVVFFIFDKCTEYFCFVAAVFAVFLHLQAENHLYVELFLVFTLNTFGATPNIADCLNIDLDLLCDGFW